MKFGKYIIGTGDRLMELGYWNCYDCDDPECESKKKKWKWITEVWVPFIGYVQLIKEI